MHIEFLSALLVIHSRLDHFSRIWEGEKLVSSGRQSPDTESCFQLHMEANLTCPHLPFDSIAACEVHQVRTVILILHLRKLRLTQAQI